MIKRICFFANFYDFPKQKTLTYCEKIFPNDIEIFLFCPEVVKEKFKVRRAKVFTSKTKLLVPFELREFCRKNEIDVLTNLGGSGKVAFALFLSTLFTKTKTLFCLRGNIFSKKRPGFRFFISRIPNDIIQLSFLPLQFFISRFTAGGEDITEKLRRLLFFTKKKIFYLPTVIDTDLFKPKNKENCRKKLKIDKREKVILFVGRVQYTKGSDFLLKIIKQNPDKKFILIGKLMDENYKKEELKNLILIPSITEKEIVNYYNAADLCLFLSRIEGSARVPREAMACGCPTIVSNVEMLRTLKTAIKVPFKIDSIQRQIDNLFNLSEEKKKHLSILGRKFIIKEHSEKALREKYLKYFLEF